jgi:hypothetical protein
MMVSASEDDQLVQPSLRPAAYFKSFPYGT